MDLPKTAQRLILATNVLRAKREIRTLTRAVGYKDAVRSLLGESGDALGANRRGSNAACIGYLMRKERTEKGVEVNIIYKEPKISRSDDKLTVVVWKRFYLQEVNPTKM